MEVETWKSRHGSQSHRPHKMLTSLQKATVALNAAKDESQRGMAASQPRRGFCQAEFRILLFTRTHRASKHGQLYDFRANNGLPEL